MKTLSLRAIVELIESELENGADARDLLMRLVAEHGFKWARHGDPERLLFVGISASCTAGGHGLLRNWCAAARRNALF